MRIGNLRIAIGARRRGVSLSATEKLIKSLNPILYIKDMTVVVGGYLVDSSGNDKQIAITSAGAMGNDTLTMPANDADIIAALIADGNYNYFYTDDATPKAVRIGWIALVGARRLYWDRWMNHFCLFADEPSLADQVKLYEALCMAKAFLPDVNMLKLTNYFRAYNPNALIAGSQYNGMCISSNDVYDDNTLDFSVSKKTRVGTVATPSTIDNEFYSAISKVSAGNMKFSLWIDVSELNDRHVIIYWNDTRGTTSLHGSSSGALLSNIKTYNIGYTWAIGTIGSGEIKERAGTWVRLEIQFTAVHNGKINWIEAGIGSLSYGYAYGTIESLIFKTINIQLTQGYSGILLGDTDLDGSYEKMASNTVGLKVCTCGDSITLGGIYPRVAQYLYGWETIYNCAQSGRRISNNPPNDAWQDIATVVAQPADVFILLYSANDNSATIGSLDNGLTNTYYGGYQQYIEYLLANIPDVANKKIVLVTSPFTVGSGNTLEQGRALYETQFINMANAVKAIGEKYSLPVCDLHGEMAMNWDNAMHFLSDGTHWTFALDYDAAKIIGKFINDLYA